ncbi:gastrula zinc finger protein XlCGF57.1-like isoform X1 [Sebastes umbrosus]|uniref:gastrula zinc finger protein XlCGF57.1-like isoform X1 n=1 Tax=Sebastes umbrosus TaxID=72105 RepID=UPI00189D613C|nr:gastrula zinc finger protein XlCGF57.1-like isoform X1 [Sebastes umbrosus]
MEEHNRQRRLLVAVFHPQLWLHRAVSTDVQQLLVSRAEVPPEQQEWSSSLDQEDPEPPHIKEEQEDLWTSQEGEQLQGLEEADIKFPFSPVSVKSEEDDEEKPQSSQLHERQTEQMETEADGEDCGGPEPARNSDPDSPLQPATHDKTSPSSEPETDDSREWEETKEPQSGFNSLQNNEVPVSDVDCNTSIGSSECVRSFDKGHLQKQTGIQTGGKTFSCSVCSKRFSRKNSLITHMILHSEGNRFTCSVCKRSFGIRGNLVVHMRTHTGEKPFSCSVCSKTFTTKQQLKRHMRIHTGEKPFSCSVCSRTFAQKQNLIQHSTLHTGEKPFSCSVCGKRFTLKQHLKQHSTSHTGEKPFNCSVCSERFALKGELKRHLTVHTGEKPFSCSVCGKEFVLKGDLNRHLTVHTGEKPFSCSVCGKRFTLKQHLKQHSTVHTGETI